jgi:hypothetical protein
VATVVMAACGELHVMESEDRTGSSSQEARGGSCTNVDCGENGAMIDGIYFRELYLPPPPFLASPWQNGEHVKIAHFYKSEADWFHRRLADPFLDVVLGKFSGVQEGAILELRSGGRTYLVKLEHIDRSQVYWTKPAPGANAVAVELYWFTYTKPIHCEAVSDVTVVCTNYQPLCKDKLLDGEMMMPAVVFEGDRYMQDTLTVMDSGMMGPGWFNIACSGSLPMKMHMIRRTQAAAMDPGGPPMPIAPLRARQAFMNMWSANYCGDAYSFTENGTQIRIRDRLDSMSVDLPVGFEDEEVENGDVSIEAVWGPDGALCLNKPRLEAEHSLEEVQAHCAALSPPRVLRECPADVLTTWKNMPSATVLSAIPKPEPEP